MPDLTYGGTPNATIEDSATGRVKPGARCVVTDSAGAVQATVYRDDGVTTYANGIVEADARGRWVFMLKGVDYAADYYIEVEGDPESRVHAGQPRELGDAIGGAVQSTAVGTVGGPAGPLGADGRVPSGQTSDTGVRDLLADPGTASGALLSDTFARRTIVNALNEGVVADGTTNDTAAWQALLDASTPGTILTWTGTSKLGSTLVWKSGVSLMGAGWGRSVLAPTHATNYFPAIQYTPANGASTTAPLEDCTFSGFEVDGSGIAGTAANISAKAIFAQFLRRCQFLHLYLHDTGATALGTDYMPECLIDGVVVERAGRNWDGAAGGHAGIGIGTGAWEHEPVAIVNSHAIDCGHWGIFVEWQDGQPFRSRGARIVNCTARGTEGVGIGDRGCAETLIQGCHISEGLADGIQVSYGASGGQILDNIVVDNANDGIHFDIDAGDSWRVAGNKAGRNAERGIYFDGHTGTYSNHAFENNECWANGYQGLLVDSIINGSGLFRNLVVRDNRCYNNGQGGGVNLTEGIRLEADITGLIVAGNHCYDNQTTKTQTIGVKFSDSSSYTFTDGHITGNHLTGNSAAQLSVGAVVRTNVVFRNNVGALTEARGIGTIPDTAATVTIIHGLAFTPTSVVITPKDGNEALWLTTIGAGGFIVNRAGTTGARQFTWIAEV